MTTETPLIIISSFSANLNPVFTSILSTTTELATTSSEYMRNDLPTTTNPPLDPIEQCVNVNEYLNRKAGVNDWSQMWGVRIIFGMVYIGIFAFGLITNLGVIGSVFTNSRLHSARNLFLLNLMFADVLLCLFSVPITPTSIVVKQWLFGTLMCHALPFIQSVSVMVISWSLTVIALDKAFHIANSTRMPVTKSQALIITSIVWIVSCAVNVPFAISMKVESGPLVHRYADTPGGLCGSFCIETWSSEVAKEIYGTTVMAVSFVLPTMIISISYWIIFTTVRRDMIIDSEFSASLSNAQKLEAMRRRRRVNYILVGMVGAFILSWMPLNMFNIMRDYKIWSLLNKYPYIISLITHSIAMTSVIWNPLLFYWLTRQRNNSKNRHNAQTRSQVCLSGDHMSQTEKSRFGQLFSRKRSMANGHEISYYSSPGTLTLEAKSSRVQLLEKQPTTRIMSYAGHMTNGRVQSFRDNSTGHIYLAADAPSDRRLSNDTRCPERLELSRTHSVQTVRRSSDKSPVPVVTNPFPILDTELVDQLPPYPKRSVSSRKASSVSHRSNVSHHSGAHHSQMQHPKQSTHHLPNGLPMDCEKVASSIVYDNTVVTGPEVMNTSGYDNVIKGDLIKVSTV